MNNLPQLRRIILLRRIPRTVVPERKLCIYCEHVYLGGVSGLLEFCRHPMNLKNPSTVDGSTRTIRDPEELRADPLLCGPEGVWWKPQTGWRGFWRRLWGD